MLEWVHYGSTNETYKFAYEKPPFSPRIGEYEFYEVRKLPSFKKTTHSLFRLWFLSRKKDFGFNKKSGKEAKES